MCLIRLSEHLPGTALILFKTTKNLPGAGLPKIRDSKRLQKKKSSAKTPWMDRLGNQLFKNQGSSPPRSGRRLRRQLHQYYAWGNGVATCVLFSGFWCWYLSAAQPQRKMDRSHPIINSFNSIPNITEPDSADQSVTKQHIKKKRKHRPLQHHTCLPSKMLETSLTFFVFFFFLNSPMASLRTPPLTHPLTPTAGLVWDIFRRE